MTEQSFSQRREPVIDEWNESLQSDYLWSNVNFGEAVSEVMTPLTWSLLRMWRKQWASLRDIPPLGNIGGRLYLNISYPASALAVLGKSQPEIMASLEDMLHMPVPEGMEIPVVSLSKGESLAFIARSVIQQIHWKKVVSMIPGFVQSNPAWCRAMRRRISSAGDPNELALLWEQEIRPRSLQAYVGVLSSAMRFSNYTGPVRQKLIRLVGPEDADVLISNLSGEAELLASLGPLVGLAELARGEMTREEYVERYGYRGPNEWEVFQRRPAEDPTGLDERIAEFREAKVDVDWLLRQQREKAKAAWQRFQERLPQEASTVRTQLDEIAKRGRLREAVRSEIVRVIWVMRIWALRAGELTRLGDGTFFLSVEQARDVLCGDPSPISKISEHRKMYASYRALPTYPALIRGPFDPFLWAADPNWSSEVYDAQTRVVASADPSDIIRGSAGSAGRVEGVARVARTLEEGYRLLPGEILVTPLTDIGWTSLFPRAAAIVTDTGAALSHAAIVARELGIPAVVGCGNATQQLKTGDRLWVDGTRGIVERVKTA